MTLMLSRPWTQRAGLASVVLTSSKLPPSVLGSPAYMTATMTWFFENMGSTSTAE
jgi:hypothetical protein